MYSWEKAALLTRALEAATKAEVRATCLCCGDARELFPQKVYFSFQENGEMKAIVESWVEKAGEDRWLSTMIGKAWIFICPDCARRKDLVPKPEPGVEPSAAAAEEDLGGVPAIAEELKKLEISPLRVIPAPKTETGTEEDVPF